MSDDPATPLTGKILLAMPGMGDPRFHKAVILVCAHDPDGAMGLVINQTLPGIDLRQLLDQLNIRNKDSDKGVAAGVPVLSGGPVENGRGFILHSSDFYQSDTVRIGAGLSVTGTVDALRAVAAGEGPQHMVFVLGYAGWSAGQLDREIQDNVWLVFDANPDVVFSVQPDDKWDTVIRRMGIDPAMLSVDVGRA